MKKKDFIKIQAVVIMIVFMTAGSAWAEESVYFSKCDIVKEAIEQSHKYPIKVGTEEWKSYSSSVQRIGLLRIGDKEIANMSTLALAISVLSHPYLSDIWAYNTLELGYLCSECYLDGLKELLNREDFEEAYDILKDSKEIFDYVLVDIGDEETNTAAVRQEIKLIGDLYDLVHEDDIQSEIQNSGVHYVSTPNGSSVAAVYGYTYADFNTSVLAVKSAQTKLLAQYDSAVIVTDVSSNTSSYNCHSYAWHSTSTSNKYWINNPSAYMTDGSYASGTARVGFKVFWSNSSYGTIHSGIVYSLSTSATNPTKVTSKWGMCGVIRHNTNDCPYSNSAEYGSGIVTGIWNRSS